MIKAQAGMDIAEKRRPLDGRWIQRIANQQVDLRINIIPTLFGEDLTLRILSRETKLIELGELGMTQRNINEVRAILESPSGLILVSGPTGTGKTTTLYTCLRMLHNGRRKLNTIEDPIEYAISGIRQSQVNPKIGVEFPDLLRSILRQAPDVIMIGEIRDAETAVTAVRAANSGHLVLATLHAPIAAGAIQSLLALGVHPHFLSTSLLGIVAQRLVRKLCPHCKHEFDLTDSPQTFSEVRHLLEEGQGRVMYGPQGCERCYGDGYRDRTGVFEVMTFDRTLRHMISDGKSTREIEAKAVEQGMVEFRRAALLKVAQGVTSTEEVLRAVPVEYLGID